MASAAEIERLAHGDDGRDVAARLRSRRSRTSALIVFGGAAEEHQPDVAAAEQFVHRERIQAVANVFLGGELVLELRWPGGGLR